MCNAVLLPHVAAFNAKAVPELYVDMAVALGAPAASPEEAVPAALNAIRSLASDVGIPRNLADLGVRTADFQTLAANAMADACGATNPRVPTKEEVVELFRQAHQAGA